MNKRLYTYILIIIVITLTIYFFFNGKKTVNKYTREWRQIEQFSEQNLPDSIVSKIDFIYRAALKEKNYEQVVKAIIFQVNHTGHSYNYAGTFMESNYDDSGTIIDLLKKEAEALPQPSKSILYSLIGQLYETYYDQHARRISMRTYVAINPKDIHTWSPRQIIEEAVYYYDLSLKDKKALLRTNLSDYNGILTDDADLNYQPTLYDLLAGRALAFYASTFNMNVLYDDFIINDPDYFEDVKSFVKMDLPVPDEYSPGYLSLRLYQNILRFHLKKSNHKKFFGKTNDNIAALIDADLQRISYLKEKGRYADKDSLYEHALMRMSEEYKPYIYNAKVLLTLGNFYFNQGNAWHDTKQVNDKSGYTKAYDICKQIETQYPGQFTEQVDVLKQKIKEKTLEMKIEAVQLPDEPILTSLKFRNIDTLYQIIYSLEGFDASVFFKSADSFHHDYLVISQFTRSFREVPIRKKKIPLGKCNDFQKYTTEVKIDPLPKGNYVILYSDQENTLDPDKTYSAALIQCSSLMAQELNVSGAETFIITDRKTGKPVPDAKITLYRKEFDHEEYEYKEIKKTIFSDKNGIAKTSYKEYQRSDHYKVEHKDDRLLVFDTSYSWESTYLPGSYHAIIFTDRSIYRPMQTVYFKAILFKDITHIHKKLLTGTSVNVRFRDTNGNTIAEKTHISNEFGSIDGSFDIPPGLLNGNMTIDCSYGYESIRVEEYKRPTFEVKFDPINENFTLNEKITVTAKASDLAGYVIDNADVRYKVVCNSQPRYRYSRFSPPDTEQKNICSGSAVTDEQGSFSITFDALADDTDNQLNIYTYTVSADVTDVNGETRSASININVGNNPLLINTNLPDNLFSGKLDGFKIETTNLNGESTPASVNVEIIPLKSPEKIYRKRIWDDTIDFPVIPEDEFYCDFPLDAYLDESNPSGFKELNPVAHYTVETDKNKLLDLSSLQHSGYYKIKFTADNKKGVVAEDIRYVYMFTDEALPISNMDQWLTVVKDTGEPGEYAEFRIAGSQDTSYIYVELIHENRVLETKWITTSKIPKQITFPIKEKYRGGFVLQFCMIQHNRSYVATKIINVPFTNKMLDVILTTYRDKLLPGENETWTLKVSNKQGNSETAEVVASLYDASLDAIKPFNWYDLSDIYHQDINVNSFWWLYNWNRSAIDKFSKARNRYHHSSGSTTPPYSLSDINWFNESYIYALSPHNLPFGYTERYDHDSHAELDIKLDPDNLDYDDLPPPPPPPPLDNSGVNNRKYAQQIEKSLQNRSSGSDLFAIKARTNFNETAFFYPKLRTNEKGEVLIEFTMPETLTRWKLLGFAHTKDFKIGTLQHELVTQKQVAVAANPPRFFRENDKIEFTAKVNNLTESDLSGRALLQVYDAITMQPVDVIIKSEKSPQFSIKKGGSAGVKWQLSIPEGIQAITYKVTAQTGTHSDGEEKTIPVLINSILVTETMPFSIRAGQAKTFTFDHLIHNKSKTLRQHSLTLEFTSAPAWYAVQALPYIMEYPYECAEQTFSRFYANTLATAIVNKTPRIKQVFDTWNAAGSEAFLTNLEKNQELKQVLLEETPWVMQAKNESGRKKRLGLLFDLNRMSNEKNRAFNTLKNIHNKDGGFPWFDKNPSSRFITQHIIAGIGHLEKLGALHESYSSNLKVMKQKSLRYMDTQIWQDYDGLIRSKADMEMRQISSIQLHYLYACSFSNHKPKETQLNAFNFYLKQTETYWRKFSTYEKAIAALVLYRNDMPVQARAIIHFLKVHAIRTEEMGMYWIDNVAGYCWDQAPIETQAMLIEAFDEVTKDETAVEEMKIWLLRNKQTNDWKTTKATSEAIYALLMTGSKLLDESKLLEIEIGNEPLANIAKEDINPEAGTGYIKTSWQGSDINPQMGTIKITNPNRKGIAWGGMYWQYFEQSDKISSAETNLKMNKQLFLRVLTNKGGQLQPVNENNKLKVGDLVCVRMELRADRDYEYVHLKDMRASGFEPIETTSGYRYQDGLWYYESVKDASTNFFITYLQKGVYVFEYDLRVSHVGDFSNGITTFQCMYAPEFSAHSEGIRIKVSEE